MKTSRVSILLITIFISQNDKTDGTQLLSGTDAYTGVSSNGTLMMNTMLVMIHQKTLFYH
jgi:hypothetical protein